MRKYVRITTNGVTRRLHRVIMEEYLGRPLTKAEVVHHKNRKRDDNRLENLQILSYKEHASVHKEDVIKATNRWRKKWMRENMEKEKNRPRIIFKLERIPTISFMLCGYFNVYNFHGICFNVCNKINF